MSTQRRVAPTLAMVAAIAGAVTLATLFPLNASGSWSVQPDEWETARTNLIERQFGDADPAVPESLMLLERTPDDGFFYAADTEAGELQTGIIDIDGGGVMCTSGSEPGVEPNRQEGFSCGTHAADEDWYYILWAQRSPSDAGGYRHKLRYFATEAEFDAYWEAMFPQDDTEAPGPTE
ncbi:hypothetical protein [Leucobacter chromiireducens]|uniref:hypothetical protein n=1 Tax=Leucobacter chromiireducens TaxID=283877 RepID=UPI003F7E1EB1